MTESTTSTSDYNADGHVGDVAHGSYEGPTESIEALGDPPASTAGPSDASSGYQLRSRGIQHPRGAGDTRGSFRSVATSDNDEISSDKNEEQSSSSPTEVARPADRESRASGVLAGLTGNRSGHTPPAPPAASRVPALVEALENKDEANALWWRYLGIRMDQSTYLSKKKSAPLPDVRQTLIRSFSPASSRGEWGVIIGQGWVPPKKPRGVFSPTFQRGVWATSPWGSVA